MIINELARTLVDGVAHCAFRQKFTSTPKTTVEIGVLGLSQIFARQTSPDISILGFFQVKLPRIGLATMWPAEEFSSTHPVRGFYEGWRALIAPESLLRGSDGRVGAPR